MECLFGVEFGVFKVAIQKYKDIENCDIACCFLWVRILVAHIEGGT
jgi:hypothetical protein